MNAELVVFFFFFLLIIVVSILCQLALLVGARQNFRYFEHILPLPFAFFFAYVQIAINILLLAQS